MWSVGSCVWLLILHPRKQKIVSGTNFCSRGSKWRFLGTFDFWDQCPSANAVWPSPADLPQTRCPGKPRPGRADRKTLRRGPMPRLAMERGFDSPRFWEIESCGQSRQATSAIHPGDRILGLRRWRARCPSDSFSPAPWPARLPSRLHPASSRPQPPLQPRPQALPLPARP